MENSVLEFNATRTCDHCKAGFEPRAGSGGKPQRFCSEKCRRDNQQSQRADRSDDFPNAQLSPQQGEEKNASATSPEAPAKPGEPAAPSDHWKGWNKDESVVLPEQQATALYFNGKGDLIIRQERAWDQDEDVFIFVQRKNIGEFFLGLQALMEAR